MLLLTLSWNNFSYLFFYCFFLTNTRKSCAPFIEIFFPHHKFLLGKILPRNLSSTTPPPPKPKIPLKTSVHFPIAIAICKTWSKCVTCSPSHEDCGGASHPQRHIYKVFRLWWIKWLSQNLIHWLWGKMSAGGSLGVLQCFGHLKRALELLISVKMSLPATFLDHWVDTITPGKKKKTRIRDMSSGKNAKFHIFIDEKLKLPH